MKLTKAELIWLVSEQTKLSKAQVRKTFDAMMGELILALKRGDSVELRNLFVLKVETTPARTGVFPKAGQPRDIPEHRIIKVRMSPKLKKAVW